jgi:hypothetical protein
MNEIDDYAPALLRIKAAVKELESALPAKDWKRACALASEAEDASKDLYWKASNCFVEEKYKAKQAA